MKPLISIILPTYNGKSEWISKSIDSVLNQTFKDFELIIINDASTNNIEETVLRYKNQDHRIIYLKNEKNLKLSKTLNKGIEYARGEYIARIDDDDIWANNDKLEKQLNFLQDNKEYGIVGAGKSVIINENGDTVRTLKLRVSDNEIRNTILQASQFIHSGVMIRKNVLDIVGLYNNAYYPAEDYELWCRIGVNHKFYNIEDITILYRINFCGMTQKNQFTMKKMSFKIFRKYKKYYPNFMKALILRIGEIILPDKLTKSLVHMFRKH